MYFLICHDSFYPLRPHHSHIYPCVHNFSFSHHTIKDLFTNIHKYSQIFKNYTVPFVKKEEESFVNLANVNDICFSLQTTAAELDFE